ncbi:MAG: AMP-binding protein [Pseudooceanicola sp.]
MTQMKTTRPVRPVLGIDDIRAIEAQPYDDIVTAHTIYDLLRATADSHGDRMALTVLRSPDPGDIGVSLTHRQLLGDVTRAANLFRALGLAPGKGVAAFLTPTLPEFPALLLGAQVAGVASTINYLLSRDAVADLLIAQGATILVIPAKDLDPMCWDKAQGILSAVPTLRHVVVIGDMVTLPKGFIPLGPLFDAARSDAPDFAVTAGRNDICALFHTGGTTGQPKLVPLTHGNQIHAAFGFGQVFGYDETDTVLNGFPFFHVGGTMTVGLSVLAAGGHMIVPSPYALRPTNVMDGFWHIAESFSATVVSGVPTSIAAMATAWNDGVDAYSIRMAVTGGAVLPAAIGNRFEQTTGIPIYETYGMTETAAAIAFNPGRGTRAPGSVGLRAPYSQTRIVRVEDAKTACATGESGLVQVRGPQVFSGYVENTHTAGVLDDGWLTTGDVGYLDEAERLYLTGREKDLIVRSGHNIDPAAIEDVANTAPNVDISAAVGMPDQYAGEVPVLFVVPRPGAEVNMAALYQFLEDALHEPPARPRRVMIIDALPVTAVGKVFKPALREMAIAEKVRLETIQHCGDAARVDVRVSTDTQKRVLVDVLVSDATAADCAALGQALLPLPQTFRIIPNCVGFDTADRVATLTLDRPDALNAASRALMWSLEQRLLHIADMPDLRAVILTGAGRAFCAGGDLKEFSAALDAGGSELVETLAYNQRVISMIESLPMPVIGAVNGVAVAGGFEMLLCCDMVLAAQTAQLGDGHAKYAILPTGGSTARLHDRIGPVRAAQLLYTAGLIDAATACDWGLVNEVVAPEHLMPRARAIAADVAACSPQVLGEMKRLVTPMSRQNDQASRLTAELDRFAAYQSCGDLAEGLAAFRDKRRPDF